VRPAFGPFSSSALARFVYVLKLAVARPIAKRRAGLLGWLASPDGGKDSLLFASGCGPVRFDLDYSLFSGHESEAADRSVRSTQTNPPDAPPIHA